MKNELKQVLNDFIALAKTHYDRKGNEYLLEQLEVALDKLEHNVQDEVDEGPCNLSKYKYYLSY